MSLPIPRTNQSIRKNLDEQLIDPRLIPEKVRRSLLALHRESQENVNALRRKEKTSSENDVNGAFASWKFKMKSKLKRTHHQQQRTRSHSNTPLNSPIKIDNKEYDQCLLDCMTMRKDSHNSTRSSDHYSTLTTPLVQRSLKTNSEFTKQDINESESTQEGLQIATGVCVSTNEN